MIFKSLVLLALVTSNIADASAPQLYRQPAYESPVRGDPDDLLLLAGYGFAAGDVVVYRALSDTTRSLPAPTETPSGSAADFGLATIVAADFPYALTVKLPSQLRPEQSYAFWVRTADGEWSKPVLINDARPLWFSPAYAYATVSLASLPRELKIVGRNLEPSPGHSTRIRLVGPQVYTDVAIDSRSNPVMARYVARMSLPHSLKPGAYRVEVSRDDTSWLTVPDQSLEVLTDPVRNTRYSVGDSQFGACRPDDGADDTPCILRALAAAARSRHGAVRFGPGTWDLIDSSLPGVVPAGGIIVPDGVSIEGAGSRETTLQKHSEWNSLRPTAAFTLIGHTVVTGMRFRDVQEYRPSDVAGAFLQVGENFQRAVAGAGGVAGAADAVAEEIVITRNEFDKTMIGVADGGLPIHRMFITYNTFGAYHSALELGGNRFNMAQKFRIDDSVIDHNSFKPSSKLDLVGKTGTIATEIGAGRRLDFSDNEADGSSIDYLYHPTDPRGWRAAFFWNLNGNVEESLTSQNTATCTGDKIGDGEAIAYDNNANTFAFKAAPVVAEASAASVTVSAPLLSRQNDRDVPIETYYVDHWVQIVGGPGLGQVRRIAGYSIDSLTHRTTFRVVPAWDVIPAPGATRIAVGREFWQVMTIDNRIDQRQPLCQKSNRSRRDAGAITLWAQSADAVIEGNRQFDTDGILFQQAYLLPEHACADCGMQSFSQFFLEVRANLIDGEYDWSTNCSSSGIVAGMAASPWNDATPPTVGFGVDISHNTIKHAVEQRGGAISIVDTWFAGPPPHRWTLSSDMLVHHNRIQNIEGAAALPRCGGTHPRVGIKFSDSPIAWRTSLYANSCVGVTRSLGGTGSATVHVCPSSAKASCECP